nr:dimethylsulfonioproprionate lyase family protein [uncultured Gellertiella sp.]
MPENALRRLVGEIHQYLTKFPGDGIADVRAGIERYRDGPQQVRTARQTPVLQHLARALEVTAQQGEPGLAEAIRAAAPHLEWITYNAYGPEQIGAGFANGHAFATLLGEEGAFFAKDFDMGIFLIEPNIFYRDHKHQAPELYAPLTGPHGWRFEPGAAFEWLEANVPVWNVPNRPHATITGSEPFLCIFCWTKDAWEPAYIIPSDDWAAIDTALANGNRDAIPVV